MFKITMHISTPAIIFSLNRKRMHRKQHGEEVSETHAQSERAREREEGNMLKNQSQKATLLTQQTRLGQYS